MKIGFELVAFTFFKIHANAGGQGSERFEKKMTTFLDRYSNVVRGLRGEGMGSDGVLASYHTNFMDFAELVRDLKAEAVGIDVLGNFLASLHEERSLRPSSFKRFKEYAEKTTKE